MTEIKVYKEITTIKLFDWEVETKMPLKELYQELQSDSKFIMIWGKIIAKNQIKECTIKNIDWLDNFILSQTEDIRNKIKEKRKWLKDNLNKEMSLEYAKNFVSSLINTCNK